MYLIPLNRAEQRRHRRHNLVQSVLLLALMVLLLAACGWTVAGQDGVLWTLLLGAVSLLLSPRLSPRLVLAMYRAERLPPDLLPELYRAWHEICRRAGLDRVPPLYYVPSRTLNAFAVGGRGSAAVVVTDGMLRHLDRRELAAVLAHEASHIRNHDLWVTGLADAVARLTAAMALFGTILLLVNLPLLLLGMVQMSWLLIVLLLAAPTLSALLQLALSRTREFDADADAAGLTGDPAGLASALAKLEAWQGSGWESILLPRRRPEPSLLRTHPPTGERIRRLLALRDAGGDFGLPVRPLLPAGFRPPPGPARRRLSGVWY